MAWVNSSGFFVDELGVGLDLGQGRWLGVCRDWATASSVLATVDGLWQARRSRRHTLGDAALDGVNGTCGSVYPTSTAGSNPPAMGARPGEGSRGQVVRLWISTLLSVDW